VAIRLNGWQRLWIVLSILYLIPVVGLAIVFWPMPETTWHRDEFIAQMPAELRQKVVGAYASKWKREEVLKSKKASPPYPDGFIPDPIEFPNGALIDTHAAVMQKDMERVAAAYWAVVESNTRNARREMAWQMALVWAIPCFTLYAVGWAAAWVRRGFRSGHVED